MNRITNLLCVVVISVALFKGCVSVPFEVAGDVIGAGFDVAGAVVEVPFEVAGAIVDVPGDIFDSSWDGEGNHRLQHKTTEAWDFDAAEISRIIAETRNGSIKVLASNDNQIHLEAQINIYCRDKKNAVEYAENVILEPRIGEGQLSINTQNPNPPKNIWIAAHYTIYTPREMSVTLRSTNALITVDDLIGDLYAKTTNGKIIAHNIIGPIQAYTTNGRI
jgi:frataxin-like iron-binding protein CyaY